jgi:hypothetical protein
LITFLAQLGSGLLKQVFELYRVAIGAAGDLGVTDMGIGAVNDRDAKLAIAILLSPGDALERLERAVGNQKSFVDTERGGHGVFSLYAQSSDVPSVGLTVRLVTCTDAPNSGSGHTQSKEISSFFQMRNTEASFES